MPGCDTRGELTDAITPRADDGRNYHQECGRTRIDADYHKWAFVCKKQKNYADDDARHGDGWDHVALDPEIRLVVSLVVGKRTADATHALVRDFRRRTGSRVMRLMTSDEYPVYEEAIRGAYGTRVTPPRTGRQGRPRNPYTTVPPEVTYATVHKEKENNRVVRVSTRVVLGTAAAVALVVAASAVGPVVNTSFVERHNGTDRNRCSRKVRKSMRSRRIGTPIGPRPCSATSVTTSAGRCGPCA